MPEARGFTVRALGEIAIRCRDHGAMVSFYRDIVGLEILRVNEDRGIVFFRVAEGFAGHTAVLALFRDDNGGGPIETGARSSLHHIALSLPCAEQENAMRWYERNGVPFTVEIFAWAGWRGVFTRDPDGNTVELVAFDASLLEASATE